MGDFFFYVSVQSPRGTYGQGADHNILDFREREFVTLGEEAVEKKMATITLVKPRWNHNISDFQRILSDK